MSPSFPSTHKGQELAARGLALQAQYQRLQEHYQHIRSRYLLVVCAWCQKRVRWQRKEDPASPVHTSHEICPACMVYVSGELSVLEPNTLQTRIHPERSGQKR
jgi:hypothetical protein